MRNISFSLTEAQFIAGTKDVTRRLGWKFLRPGDRLRAVRKAMGLKPGQKIHALGEIEILDVRRERLDAITPDEVRREGFGNLGPDRFIDFFCRHMNATPATVITRIEFRKIPAAAAEVRP